MEEGNGKNEEIGKNVRDEVFAKPVRAGKRTYFFDVKTTRKNDYYLTITESKKKFGRDGKSYYEKHKIFLYKEDFEKFVDGLNEALNFIKKTGENGIDSVEHLNESEMDSSNEYTNVEFEDLETKKE
jgi:hypothetical protein